MPEKRWSLAIYEKERHDMEAHKIEMAKVTEESIESTRRMINLVNQCDDAGINTLRMLEEQGESLKRTEKTVDEVKTDLDDGEKTLNRMNKMEKVPLPLLPIYMLFKKDPPPISETGQAEAVEDSDKKPLKNYNYDVKYTESSNRFFGRVNHDHDDEIDANLGYVSSHVLQLKQKALQIGETVDTQNERLDRLNKKTEDNNVKLDNLNAKSKKLLDGSSNKDDSYSPSSSFFPCSWCNIL